MAGEIAVEDQDKLAQLFGGKLGGTPGMFNQAAAGVTPGAQGAPPPGPQPAPVPGMPGSTAGPAAAPPASDDPRLQSRTSPMPGTPAAPSLPVPPVFQAPNLDRMQQIDQQLSAAEKPVNKADYQPKWWQRALAVPVGVLESGMHLGQGINAGRTFAAQDYNTAVRNQGLKVAPLEREFERQSKIEPYVRDVNENKQRTFADQDAAYKNYNTVLDREQSAKDRKEAAAAATDVKQQNENRKEEEDKTTPAPGARPQLTMVNGKPQLVVPSKSGAKIPYVPKSIEEGAMLGDPTSRALFDRMHRDANEAKPGTRAQYVGVQNKRDQVWGNAKTQYDKAVRALDPPPKPSANETPEQKNKRTLKEQQYEKDKADLQNDYYEAIQEGQNSYEQNISTLGGTPEHIEIPRNHFGEAGATVQPAAQSGPTSTAAPPKFDLGADAQGNVTKAKVQELATQRGTTYAEAEKTLKGKGYTIR